MDKINRKLISLASVVGEIQGEGDKGETTTGAYINDTSIIFPIHYNKKGLKLLGDYNISITNRNKYTGQLVIKNWNTSIELLTAVTEDENGILRFEVKPKTEGLIISDINSVVFDPKDSKLYKKLLTEKRWVFGPTISTGLMINPSNNTAGIYIGVGIGITYKLKARDIKKLF